MKKYIMLFIIFVLFVELNVFAETKKIVQDSDGKFIEAVFNEQGIIEKLKGTISEYSVEKMNIKVEKDTIKIHKESSGDGCYNIEIKNHREYLTLTKIFTANKVFNSRDNLIYNIYFNDNDEYFIKDDFITVSRTDKKTHVSDSSDSYLPKLKYEDNTCIQFFGKTMPEEDIGSRKYVYSDDMKNIVCSLIMPGDVWEEYMTATVFDFKSDNKAVNVINYIILYNYDYQLGVMFFPILLGLNESDTKFIDPEITADSYLTEGNTKYLPERLRNTEPGTPWCEGKPGDGIGSIITLKGNKEFSTLIISNGFDSAKKQNYTNNNRVKEIRITNLNNKKNLLTTELPDSPQPFEIKLPFSSDYVQIEILSVYKGEKYEDTCLNYILAK